MVTRIVGAPARVQLSLGDGLQHCDSLRFVRGTAQRRGDLATKVSRRHGEDHPAAMGVIEIFQPPAHCPHALDVVRGDLLVSC